MIKYNRDLIIKIENDIEKRLSNSRYLHTMGVAGCAVSLAMRYGADINKAYIAGLLHDYSKEYSSDEFLRLANKYDINVSLEEKEAPYLLHGKIASEEAKRDYLIEDDDVLNAVSYHTCGRCNMSLLEKIVYIADYIEPHRREFQGLGEIRKEAFNDIDKTMYLILGDVINYLKSENRPIVSISFEAYDYYSKLVNKGK